MSKKKETFIEIPTVKGFAYINPSHVSTVFDNPQPDGQKSVVRYSDNYAFSTLTAKETKKLLKL